MCKDIKKIRSSQPAMPVLKWVKHQSFPVRIVKCLWKRLFIRKSLGKMFMCIWFDLMGKTFFSNIIIDGMFSYFPFPVFPYALGWFPTHSLRGLSQRMISQYSFFKIFMLSITTMDILEIRARDLTITNKNKVLFLLAATPNWVVATHYSANKVSLFIHWVSDLCNS